MTPLSAGSVSSLQAERDAFSPLQLQIQPTRLGRYLMLFFFLLSFTLVHLPSLIPLTPTHILYFFPLGFFSPCDLKSNNVSTLSLRHLCCADTRSPLQCLSLINMICSPTCFHHFYYSNILLSISQQIARLVFVVLTLCVN